MVRRGKSKTPALEERSAAQRTDIETDVQLVTPSTSASRRGGSVEEHPTSLPNARRTLFPILQESSTSVASLVTPQPSRRRIASDIDNKQEPPAKRRLIFGKYVDLVTTQPNVQHVYKIVKNLTGSIGGNGHVGPIYGELTMGSMQKMVNLMMEHCDLNRESRFIDVGSGIGKPNLHVAQYPGVAFSCGIEVERSRWVLGMSCLKAVLDIAVEQSSEGSLTNTEAKVLGNTIFLHNDIMKAMTFDPFTHVYMFSIGFPPSLWLKLSDMWNASRSRFLICYHSPKDIIHNYEFDVELVTQMPTSMHGSKEGHMGYIYKRNGDVNTATNECDPVFAAAWDLVRNGLGELHEHVSKHVSDVMDSGRKTRSQE